MSAQSDLITAAHIGSLKRREVAVSAFCSIERIRIQRSIFALLVVLICLSAAAIGQKAPPAKPFERLTVAC